MRIDDPDLARLLAYGKKRGIVVKVCARYAEPGYDSGGKPLVLLDLAADRHAHPERKLLADRLDALVDVLAADEWTTCDRCGGAIRTESDSYFWKKYWLLLPTADDVEFVCGTCATADPGPILQQLVGDTQTFWPFGEEGLKKDDWYCWGRFRIGVRGTDDRPERVAETLRAARIDHFVFAVDSVEPFEACYSVWTPEPAPAQPFFAGVDLEPPAGQDQRSLAQEALRSAPVQTFKDLESLCRHVYPVRVGDRVVAGGGRVGRVESYAGPGRYVCRDDAGRRFVADTPELAEEATE